MQLGKASIVKCFSILSTITLAMLLAGCGRQVEAPPAEIRVVTKTKYPTLPTINEPAPPALKPVKFDLPRIDGETEVRNTTACMSVPADKQDDAFKRRCLVKKVDLDQANKGFVTLDSKNLKNLMENDAAYRANIKQYKARLNTYKGLQAGYAKRNGVGPKKKPIASKPAPVVSAPAPTPVVSAGPPKKQSLFSRIRGTKSSPGRQKTQ